MDNFSSACSIRYVAGHPREFCWSLLSSWKVKRYNPSPPSSVELQPDLIRGNPSKNSSFPTLVNFHDLPFLPGVSRSICKSSSDDSIWRKTSVCSASANHHIPKACCKCFYLAKPADLLNSSLALPRLNGIKYMPNVSGFWINGWVSWWGWVGVASQSISLHEGLSKNSGLRTTE